MTYAIKKLVLFAWCQFLYDEFDEPALPMTKKNQVFGATSLFFFFRVGLRIENSFLPGLKRLKNSTRFIKPILDWVTIIGLMDHSIGNDKGIDVSICYCLGSNRTSKYKSFCPNWRLRVHLPHLILPSLTNQKKISYMSICTAITQCINLISIHLDQLCIRN